MAKLTIAKGLPGSGKTTWAKRQQGAWRVNRDDVRAQYTSAWDFLNFDRERAVTAIQRQMVLVLLASDEWVIVDDTNLHLPHLTEVMSWATEAGLSKGDVTFKDFTDVPVELCIARDAARPNPVGEAVIRRMHDRYLAGGLHG